MFSSKSVDMKIVYFTPILLIAIISPSNGFLSNTFFEWATESYGHDDITEAALKHVLVVYFNSNPSPYSQPVSTNMTLDEIFSKHYGQPVPTAGFLKAQKEIVDSNTATDSGDNGGNADYHFDAERIAETNQRIFDERQPLVNTIKAQDFDTSRKTLGSILHSLQDFYSHSNWIEMDNTKPNFGIGQKENIGNVAASNEQTCTDCSGECQNNILSSINSEKLLTSGYFRFVHAEKDSQHQKLHKPDKIGKCSHGGIFDFSRLSFAKGGINKDSANSSLSPHYYLHKTAATLAAEESANYLLQLWASVTDDDFARLLNLNLSAALAVVIDTTGSMQPYIEAVKLRCAEIIQSAYGSIFQPSSYIMVPFNDPDFGPVYQTDDPQQMIEWINSLTADGGGDAPEMSFSGLQLAEEASPYGTPIFLFTDAPPKDGELLGNVLHLAQSNDLTINFCGANLGHEAKLNHVQQTSNKSDKSEIIKFHVVGTYQMYDELAAATGGYVLTTTSDTGNIFNSSAFIDSMLLSSSVNVVQSRNQSGSLLLKVPIDITIRSFTVMLSSSYNLVTSFLLLSPDGSVSNYQMLTDTSTTKYLQINSTKAGIWSLNITTTNPNYLVSVQGSSIWSVIPSITKFDYNSPHPAYQPITGNPLSGSNVTLFLTPQSNVINVTSININDALSGKFLFNLTVQRNKVDQPYLAHFSVPNHPFYFTVIGKDMNNNMAQRIMTQVTIPTTVELSATWLNTTSSILPGQYIYLSFKLTNKGDTDTFAIQATDSLNFLVNCTPTSVVLYRGMSMEGFMTLYAPPNAQPFNVSILQLNVKSQSGDVNNFLELLIAVSPPVYDTFPPQCMVLNSTLNTSCPTSSNDCQNNIWSAYMVFSDHGSGLNHVSTLSYGGNVTWNIASFPPDLQDTNVTAYALGDCCVQNATLIVIDDAGLVGRCFLKHQMGSAMSNYRNICNLLILLGAVVAQVGLYLF